MKTKHLECSSVLPTDEGIVFVAYSPSKPYFVLGRRWHGKLYPAMLYQNDGRSPRGAPGEFIEGEEAAELIEAILSDQRLLAALEANTIKMMAATESGVTQR